MLAADEVLAMCGGAACPGEECGATPSSLDCAFRLKRQRLADTDSACSTGGGWAVAHAPTDGCHTPVAPPHPAPPAASPLPATPTDIPWKASYLLEYSSRCLEALTAMHPVCAFLQRETRAAQMGCAIFRRIFLQRCPAEQGVLLREQFLAQALLAASLWIAIKFEATRTTTPDSNIMCRITGVPAGMLRQLELDILAALQYDLMGVAREVGAVGPVDLSDAPAQEQAAQLAALAQPAQPVQLHWPPFAGGQPPPAAAAVRAGTPEPAVIPPSYASLLCNEAFLVANQADCAADYLLPNSI